MGRLAVIAEEHWSRWLPEAYASIEDKPAFFKMLEDEAEEQIEVLTDALEGPDLSGETFLHRMARFKGARRDAESQVMREVILMDPEPAQVATAEKEDCFVRAVADFQEARKEFDRARRETAR